MPKNRTKQLKKSIVSHQVNEWYNEIKNRLSRELGIEVSPSLIGRAFPTSRTLAIESDMDEKEFRQINTNYWNRIEKGERGVKDKALIERIGDLWPETKMILQCPYAPYSAPLKPATES